MKKSCTSASCASGTPPLPRWRNRPQNCQRRRRTCGWRRSRSGGRRRAGGDRTFKTRNQINPKHTDYRSSKFSYSSLFLRTNTKQERTWNVVMDVRPFFFLSLLRVLWDALSAENERRRRRTRKTRSSPHYIASKCHCMVLQRRRRRMLEWSFPFIP